MRHPQKSLLLLAITLCNLGISTGGAIAVVLIDFEGETLVTNVSPTSPYLSNGFSVLSTTDQAATFDPTHSQMLGNATDFFGFSPASVITILGPDRFSLLSLDVGKMDTSWPHTIDVMITGFRSGLPNLVSITTEVSNAQTVNLNWSRLDSVTIEAILGDSAAIDNVSLELVPEPSTAILLAFGVFGIATCRQRVRHVKSGVVGQPGSRSRL